ncbi:ACP S-malonyltransferase [Dissulfurirhabdus thermomarina]|uniref:Malonyl CoA-acyl carrier protein transacylase n=2 Tax=Dissulfurirhabdus thermomarina TaxID=1765737 RepID=A0A6N9TS42_DISTH|nr:ACP S-malonyltransferase [Dissulfurirhabdus thermomarina]NMX22507.1 ACP S-malonyltransferase [Dissulfurirhabdus thermomarina]
MGRAFAEALDEARRIFETGEAVTGLPLARLCFEGPMEELTRTAHLQPALTAVEMAAAAAARASGLVPAAAAGHSLGEYPALWAAGVLSTEDTFRLVHHRGRLMEEAGTRHPGAMAAVLGMDRSALEALMAPIAREGALTLANHNSPEQIVATGEAPLVKQLCEAVKAAGARAIPLKVSGAFHSPLMAEAAGAFAALLDQVEFRAPEVPVYLNVTAEPEQDPEAIRRHAKAQMVSPVRWYETVVRMRADGIDTFLEVGPKQVLSNLVRKSLPGEAVRVLQAEDPDGLAEIRRALGQGEGGPA